MPQDVLKNLCKTKKLPTEYWENIRLIINDVSLSLEYKTICLQSLAPNEYKNKILEVLIEWNKHYIKQKEMKLDHENRIEEVLKQPIRSKIPVLSKIDKKNQDVVKLLIENGLEDRIKLLVKDKEILMECIHFMDYRKKEIKFLEKLPEDDKSLITSILREKELSIFEKRNLLKHAISDSNNRKLCKNFLKEIASLRKLNILEEQHLKRKNELKLLLDSYPDVMNLVLLGQSGVGKSTFINGLANYMKYLTMQEAKNTGVQVLIKSSFVYTGNQTEFKSVEITADPLGADSNEVTKIGCSATQEVRVYELTWLSCGNEKKIRIIDTPGVADTNGIIKDRQNFDNIFKELSKFDKIHGICVLLKPNEARLTAELSYALGELFSRLHVSAITNIIFCFTNTRGTLYKPGDTFDSLKEYLKESNIPIALTTRTQFCFDNECYRFLCAWKQGVRFDDDYIGDYSNSWIRSSNETFKLLTRISQLPGHDVQNTLCVINTRKCLTQIAKNIAITYDDERLADKIIRDKMEQIADFNSQIGNINTASKVTVTKRNYTERRDIVCHGKDCCGIDPYSNEVTYRKCCENCTHVELVNKETVGDPQIQKCDCFEVIKVDDNNSQIQCKTCKCLWSVHLQINYELEHVEEIVLNEETRKQINEIKAEIQKAKDIIAQRNDKKPKLVDQRENLFKETKELASYLVKNAILPLNKVVPEYATQQIANLRRNHSTQQNLDAIDAIEKLKDEHSQLALIIENTTDDGKTTKEIQGLINDYQGTMGNLLSIPENGISGNNDFTIVDLNQGWIGDS